MGTSFLGYQTTIAGRVELSGVGVHTGAPVSIGLRPAEPNSGVVFHKACKDGSTHEFRARVAEIGATDLCTMLGNPHGEHVATVEHLMAAFTAIGLDNVIVDIDGTEVPIMDGSARVFIEAIDEVGLSVQAVKRRYIRITKPVRIEMSGSWAEFRPYDGTRFEVVIDFECPLIGRQEFRSDMDGTVFRRELAKARTFGFMKDVERLWASGHALGSSLENSVVIGDDNRVINLEGLRYSDEFVRHKALDAVGDLALAGAQFLGCFASYRGGHRLNATALKALLSDRTAYEIVEANYSPRRARSAELIAVNAPAYAPWVL